MNKAPKRRRLFYRRPRGMDKSKRYPYSSQKYARYRQISSYDKIYTFERLANIKYVINVNGFIGATNTSPYLGLAFNLNGGIAYVSGLWDQNLSIPNVSEFITLFDRYRIDKVEVSVMFSNTETVMGSVAYPMPILYQVLDFDSIGGTSSIFEYPQCKINQLGGVNNGGIIKYTCRPRVTGYVQNNSSGTITALNASTQICPWIDTAAPNIEHFGMRFQLDDFNSVLGGNFGTISFMIRYFYSFKSSI